jgi:predicted glycoside hydrolase/deacetylase ChbG (UPF0249 family)
MKRLLLTADDFGMTRGVSAGIVESIRNGAVAATTAMVCLYDAAANISELASQISGRIGLHLQLTDGIPRCDPSTIPTLVNGEGRFPRKPHQMKPLDPHEVEREWNAQLESLRALGIEPTHLDSHHHSHRDTVALHIYCKLARSLGVPARGAPLFLPQVNAVLRKRGVRCADVFAGHWSDAEPTLDRLIACIKDVDGECPDGGTVEMMCHPAFADDALRARSTLSDQREQELRVLCSPELPERLRDIGYEIADGFLS